MKSWVCLNIDCTYRVKYCSREPYTLQNPQHAAVSFHDNQSPSWSPWRQLVSSSMATTGRSGLLRMVPMSGSVCTCRSDHFNHYQTLHALLRCYVSYTAHRCVLKTPVVNTQGCFLPLCHKSVAFYSFLKLLLRSFCSKMTKIGEYPLFH